MASQRRSAAFVAATGPGPDGRRLRIVERVIDVGDVGIYLVQVAGSGEEMEEQIARFRFALIVAFAALAIALAIGAAFQVRFGLRPLRQLQRELASIRRGERERIMDAYPSEVAPLADELNLLISANRDILERARTQVGNLAHALKTPLSVIVNEADAAPGQLAEKVQEQAQIMRDQISFYLDRARAAARGGALGAATQIAPSIEALLRAFSKIYGDKGVIFSGGADPRLRFLGERQDLEEMIGNLLDNAGKWAKSRVTIDVCVEGASRPTLRVTIDDDGPGLASHLARGGDAAWPASRRNQARIRSRPVDRRRSRCRLWRLAATRRQPQRRFARRASTAGVLSCVPPKQSPGPDQRSNGRPVRARSLLFEIEIENGDLQREARQLRIVSRDDAKKFAVGVEFDRIGLAPARHDRQTIIFEQLAQIGLQHFASDGDFHLKSEGTIAVLIVDRDRSDPSFAEMHGGIVRIFRIRCDANAVIAERTAQEGLQFLQLDFFQTPALVQRQLHSSATSLSAEQERMKNARRRAVG